MRPIVRTLGIRLAPSARKARWIAAAPYSPRALSRWSVVRKASTWASTAAGVR
jgi:hypothetical protein